MKFCNNCGEAIDDNAVKCPKCQMEINLINSNEVVATVYNDIKSTNNENNKNKKSNNVRKVKSRINNIIDNVKIKLNPIIIKYNKIFLENQNAKEKKVKKK